MRVNDQGGGFRRMPMQDGMGKGERERGGGRAVLNREPDEDLTTDQKVVLTHVS